MENDPVVQKLAGAIRVDAAKIASWRNQFSSAHAHHQRPRPTGMLALIDIARKYGVTYEEIRNWRAAGLEAKIKGRLVLIREEDLVKFLK